MQDVHTALSSCNSIFSFTALPPRLAPAPEGRWYTNEPVALMDLWHRHPGPLVVSIRAQIEAGTPIVPARRKPWT